MATNSKREASGHDSAPTLNPSNVRIFIESVIYFREVENF
jgi:hypothetical protein